MIPENDFLRRLPLIVAPGQRMDVEAIVFAHDSMAVAVETLHGMARDCNPAELSRVDRITMFMAAWAIIDSVHVVRELIQRTSPEDHQQASLAWHQATEPATLLRNKMDHPRGLLPARAGKKGAQSPTFGTIWFFRPTELTAASVRGEACFVSAGTAPQAIGATMPFAGQMDFPSPVGRFTLQAHDWTFELEPPIQELEPLLLAWSATIEAQIRAAAAKHAQETGKSVDELMLNLGEPQGLLEVSLFR